MSEHGIKSIEHKVSSADKVSHKTLSFFSSHFPFPLISYPKPKESNKHNRRRVGTMLSLFYCSSCSFSSSSKLFQTSPSLISFSPRNPRIHSKFLRTFTASPTAPNSDEGQGQQSLAGRRANYGGVNLEETVDINSGKLRLDSWISSRITGISRARVQSSIRSGLVSVNGRIVDKVFFNSFASFSSFLMIFIWRYYFWNKCTIKMKGKWINR